MTTTYTLKHPIVTQLRPAGGDLREDRIDEVTVRRVTGGDMRAIGQMKGETEMSLKMIERLTGLTARDVDKLDAEDIVAIGEIVEGFMPAGLATGKTSSAS